MNVKLIKIGLCLTGIALVLASLIYFLNPFQTALERAQIEKVRVDLYAISQSLTAYKDLNGFLPSTSQGLEALTTKPSGDPMPKNWFQLMSEVPTDPWGNTYKYTLPGKHNPKGFDIYSTGGPSGKVMGNW